MPDKTRWAIIGTGAIAARFAADMRHSRHGCIVAVGSRAPERAARFAGTIGPGIVTGRYDELLQRSDIDAFYLATPNERHAEDALAAIAAGKPVLVEKPFALSAASARSVVDAARSAGVLVMEAMWMRFTPGIVRLKDMVDSGRIGEIRRIDISLSFAKDFDASGPLFDPARGGALRDLGVYPLSLAVHLAGIPHSITASLVEAENGAVAVAGMLLGHDGAMATLSCGFDAEGANEAVVTGTSGILRAHRPVVCPPLLSLRRTGGRGPAGGRGKPGPAAAPAAPVAPVATERFGSGPLAALRQLAAGLRTERYPTPYRGSGLHYQADHFSLCLRDGLTESTVMPLDQSAAVIDLVEQAAAHARGGRTDAPIR